MYAAKEFTGKLAEWQRENMRFVDFETLGRDLGNEEFEELCGLWKGVWGLRLCVKGSARGVVGGEGLGVSCLDKLAGKRTTDGRRGFEMLTELRWVEIVLEDEDCGREEKVRFCEEVGNWVGGRERNVSVTFIEEVEVVNKEIEAKTYNGWANYGGEPGDEIDWATGMDAESML